MRRMVVLIANAATMTVTIVTTEPPDEVAVDIADVDAVAVVDAVVVVIVAGAVHVDGK